MSEAAETEDLEDLYETAPCGYLSISPDAKIAKANRTLAGWLGAEDAGSLVGKSVHEILGFGGKIAFETHLAPLLRMQGHVHEIALDLVSLSGKKLPTIANAAEKRAADGKHLFTRLTLFKAVDRRKFERSLVEARAKAEAESKAYREAALLREQFIAVLGHDIRNPLAALAAGVGLLERKEKPSTRGLAILREMAASIERATTLVDDLLDLARGSLGAGIPVNRDSEAPLTPVLEQVVSELRRVTPDREIEVNIAIDEPVFCDRARLGQLASNLLANAITHGSDERPIWFEAITERDRFKLSVANAGAPIPEDVRARLFQPFFRGGSRASRNGLGLGLYIASEIAKAHGGTLDVSSNAHETRFTFEMEARPHSE
ncbi:MAG TPA: PAS domain-containing sensor histidine kinase [Sphingomicrobium sp.]|nr:PAS domain-containing sensor histidine kinase [Sphingomicrobium sp.]